MHVDNDGPPRLRFRFDPEPGAARRARKAIGALLTTGDPIADAVLLAASELVSNAVLHARTGGEVRMWDPAPDVPLRLEVEDASSALPHLRAHTADSPDGRGLSLIAAIADAWGVDRTPGGKRVWAEFDRDAAHRRRVG